MELEEGVVEQLADGQENLLISSVRSYLSRHERNKQTNVITKRHDIMTEPTSVLNTHVNLRQKW